MKKIFFSFLIFFLVTSFCFVLSNRVESAPKKKLPAISISAIKQQIQKAKDIASALDNIFRTVAADYEARQEVEADDYKVSLATGREQLQEAESALSRAKYREARDAIAASLLGFNRARQALVGSAKWAAAKDDRIAEWQRFAAETEIRIPEALKKSIFFDGDVNLSDEILLTCAPPNIIYPRRACQGKWNIRKDMADCPYLACVKGKKEVPVCASALSYVNRDSKKGAINQKCCPGLYLTKTKNKEFMCQRTKGGVECLKDTDCPQPLCAEIPAQCMLGKCASPACALMVFLGAPAPSEAPAPPSAPTNKPSVPAAPPVHSTYDKCVIEGIKDYKCSSKKTIKWSCECFNFSEQPVADYYYQCGLKPVESCPAPTRYAPLTVTGIHIRYQMSSAIQIFWDTNKPTISQMEYGETTVYGSVFQGINSTGSVDTPDKSHFLDNEGLYVGLGANAKLRPDAIYHFRIIATDDKGNKLISDDYTFSTIKPHGSKHWKECEAGAVMQKTCLNGGLVDRCYCTADGIWSCTGSPADSCPAVVASPDKAAYTSVAPTVVTDAVKK